MRLVTLKDTVVGMLLVQPLTGANGMLILPKGTKLTPSIIQRLAKVPVVELAVEDPPPAAPAAGASPEALAPIPANPLLAALDDRFKGFEADEVMMEIKRLAGEHIAQTHTGSTESRQ